MKFSAVAFPLFALVAQQAAAVVLPLTDNVPAQLEARNHHINRQRPVSLCPNFLICLRALTP